MLKFYKNNDNSFTSQIEQKLQEMVVAHKILTVTDPRSLPENVQMDELPVLSNTHQIWKRREQIKIYLDELNGELNLSRSLQSDTCHIDPDNPDRCL